MLVTRGNPPALTESMSHYVYITSYLYSY